MPRDRRWLVAGGEMRFFGGLKGYEQVVKRPPRHEDTKMGSPTFVSCCLDGLKKKNDSRLRYARERCQDPFPKPFTPISIRLRPIFDPIARLL